LGAYRHLREVWEEAHAAHASHGLLGWLVKQDPEALVDQGVTVPREYRSLQYGGCRLASVHTMVMLC